MEEVFDEVFLQYGFLVDYQFAWVVVFVLFDLHFQVLQFSKVTFIYGFLGLEADLIYLVDVLYVEDSEATLELIRKLSNMFLIREWENNSWNLMVFASCQLFSNATDADYFT